MSSQSLQTSALSVVILTRHRPQMLAQCLESLQDDNQNLDIVVVDNSADDETKRLMADSFPTVRYYPFARTDFVLATGRNFGAAKARCEIIAFLDDDITVDPGWSSACLSSLSDENVGAVGGRVIDPEVEHNDFHRQAPICKILPNGGLTDNVDCDPGKAVETDHLRGCNWAMHREVFVKVGGFDESWDTYAYEEFDLCLRIRRAGYRLLFQPQMSAYHHLVPREGDERFGKTFTRRYQHTRMLTYAYGKSRHKALLPFLVRGDTGLRRLARSPSWNAVGYVTSSFLGKFAGLWRCATRAFRRHSTGPR